mmetsp:Transcript_4627/g.20999  ORF Transcript_4627/g.20999 Transcript_4627/m.20999 type:complete len:219 (+) Transcript_4627:286-942(+)
MEPAASRRFERFVDAVREPTERARRDCRFDPKVLPRVKPVHPQPARYALRAGRYGGVDADGVHARVFRRRKRFALLRVVIVVVVVVHGSRRHAGTGNRQRELRRNLVVVVVVAISPVTLRRAAIEILGHVHAHALPHLFDALLLARVRVVADVRQERRLRADEFIVVVDVTRGGLILFNARRLKRRGDARDGLQTRGRCLDPHAGQREARGDRVRGCE